jgi:L-amino acid N-acyltransferase YncA
MTAEYVIREATVADIEQIYDIWREGLKQSLGTSDLPSTDNRGHFERLVREQDANFKIFVADGGAQGILGFQGLAPFRANPITRHLMAESSTYIRPDAMRANVGRDLIFHALRHADGSQIQHVVAYVAITNERTLIAAQRAGFQLVGYLPKNTKASGGAPLAYLAYPAGSWSAGD